MIRSIKSTQRELQQEVRCNTKGLRNDIEIGLKEQIAGLLRTFETQWLRRFEKLIETPKITLEGEDNVFAELTAPCKFRQHFSLCK